MWKIFATFCESTINHLLIDSTLFDFDPWKFSSLKYFEEQGFTPLYLEEFSFLEQVKIFNQAQFIVGPSGAAWTNIIFCQSNIKALSWLPEQISDFSVFSTLAHLSKCDLRFVFTEANTADQVHSNYHVDLTKITQLYSIMKYESL